MNILLVASIFRLRKRFGTPDSYRLPGYPYVPLLFMVVMAFFLLSALYYNPLDSVIGILLTLAGIPVYLGLRGRGRS
jgi:APA family basic amino acid/polyamine antiporter